MFQQSVTKPICKCKQILRRKIRFCRIFFLFFNNPISNDFIKKTLSEKDVLI